MARKTLVRVRNGASEREAAREWAAAQAVPLEEWARTLDAELWDEATDFAAAFTERSKPVVDALGEAGVTLGGGGSIDLLYFLTRLQKPSAILETGVAAGWSTAAFLSAIRVNGHGHLYSSDFPYFRIKDPERYIGCVVPEELRGPWSLYIEGDRRNLDHILKPDVRVDLCHYDSDKSRPGREFFAERISGHLSPAANIVWDDIVDNLHFRDYSAAKQAWVLEGGGRRVGVVTETQL
jgi:predicted O-methyltransferase YrrM